MNAVWQVQEAKNRFSEMIERAQNEGPQVITRHGRAVAQLVAIGTALPAQVSDGFASYLLGAPKGGELQEPVRRSRKSAIHLGD